MNERDIDRQRVIEAASISIERRMDIGSVGRYVDFAREYGRKYAIDSSIQDWLMEGRKESYLFSIAEFARQWTDSLP